MWVCFALKDVYPLKGAVVLYNGGDNVDVDRMVRGQDGEHQRSLCSLLLPRVRLVSIAPCACRPARSTVPVPMLVHVMVRGRGRGGMRAVGRGGAILWCRGWVVLLVHRRSGRRRASSVVRRCCRWRCVGMGMGRGCTTVRWGRRAASTTCARATRLKELLVAKCDAYRMPINSDRAVLREGDDPLGGIQILHLYQRLRPMRQQLYLHDCACSRQCTHDIVARASSRRVRQVQNTLPKEERVRGERKSGMREMRCWRRSRVAAKGYGKSTALRRKYPKHGMARQLTHDDVEPHCHNAVTERVGKKAAVCAWLQSGWIERALPGAMVWKGALVLTDG